MLIGPDKIVVSDCQCFMILHVITLAEMHGFSGSFSNPHNVSEELVSFVFGKNSDFTIKTVSKEILTGDLWVGSVEFLNKDVFSFVIFFLL